MWMVAPAAILYDSNVLLSANCLPLKINLIWSTWIPSFSCKACLTAKTWFSGSKLKACLRPVKVLIKICSVSTTKRRKKSQKGSGVERRERVSHDCRNERTQGRERERMLDLVGSLNPYNTANLLSRMQVRMNKSIHYNSSIIMHFSFMALETHTSPYPWQMTKTLGESFHPSAFRGIAPSFLPPVALVTPKFAFHQRRRTCIVWDYCQTKKVKQKRRLPDDKSKPGARDMWCSVVVWRWTELASESSPVGNLIVTHITLTHCTNIVSIVPHLFSPLSRWTTTASAEQQKQPVLLYDTDYPIVRHP